MERMPATGDALALPLQHDLAFPRRDAYQDGQHELAGRVAGAQPLAGSTPHLGQVGLDGQQVGRAARQPVWLGDLMSINRVAAPRNQGDRSAEELHR